MSAFTFEMILVCALIGTVTCAVLVSRQNEDLSKARDLQYITSSVGLGLGLFFLVQNAINVNQLSLPLGFEISAWCSGVFFVASNFAVIFTTKARKFNIGLTLNILCFLISLGWLIVLSITKVLSTPGIWG